MIKIIVAHDENNVIGYKNGIPWYVKDDLRLFKKLTINNTVIMGRKTWDSLPIKPLKDRVNIVLSSKDHTSIDNNVIYCKTLTEALKHKKVVNDIYIIGGASIYEFALAAGVVDEVIVSLIPGKHDGDTFFPKLDVYEEWIKYHVRVFDTFRQVTYVKNTGQLNATY